MTYKKGFKNLLICIIIMIDRKRFLKLFGEGEIKMGTLVCKDCNKIIDHFEDEKVTVLYSNCKKCDAEENKMDNK